ncbi:hypothetical protein AX17_006145 [Amanita inopinata Kibby_2008]|nr:hypothetical protein AX17_006145 [Amanita inopinata Kibby_2008]
MGFSINRILFLACIVCLILFYTTFTNNARLKRIPTRESPSAVPRTNVTHTPRVLLVSALFPLAHAKHSQSEYAEWIKNFLGTVTTDVYFFTPPELEATVRAARPAHLPITINTTFYSPFSVPPLRGLEPVYEKMHTKDRERFRHSPELYAVWNAKPYFVSEAVNNLPPDDIYDYVFWNDAGSFRERNYFRTWPDPSRIADVWEEGAASSGVSQSELLFFPIAGYPHTRHKYWTESMGPLDVEFSEGSFFGGSPRALSWWSRAFYAYHDHYLSLSYFIGKDQTIFNALFLLFPERIITVNFDDAPLVDRGPYATCGWGWWYYQFWLANEEDRQSTREMWLDRLAGGWAWWRGRVPCTLAEVVPMKKLLERRFGRAWSPPEKHLDLLGI